jgi:hypothetical protein
MIYIERIKIECNKYKQIFLTELRNQTSSNSKLQEILSKDTNFMNALNDLGLSLNVPANIIT